VHSQAERHADYVHDRAAQGVHTRVVWIIEGEDEGSRLLYNTLPQVKQTDGMVNYLVGVLGQHIIQSYSTNHTAYLIAKLTQGFLEQELYRPVKVGAVRIDRSKKERRLKSAILPHSAESYRGVLMAANGLAQMLSLMPGIKTNVAKEMAATGLSLAQIVNMSLEEISALKGVGPKSAKEIHDLFNGGLSGKG
jgi:ERCC4-type nuclease